MQSKSKVALLTNDAETKSLVAGTLDSGSELTLAGVYEDIRTLAADLERSPMPLVVVDIDPDPMAVLEKLNPVVNRFDRTRFIALTGEADNGLFLKAMQIGIRHVQLKASITSELGGVLKQLTPRDFGEPRLRGNIVTVLSAGGGCGATTLSINLANEIQLASGSPVLVADFDYDYGAVGSYLGVNGQYTVTDVIGRNGNIDAELISSTALGYSENLHVLLSPASVNYADRRTIPEGRLDAFAAACRQAYRWTVIDAPRVPVSVAAKLASESLETLIVLQLSIKDVRVTEAMVSALVAHGVARSKLKVVVNRYRKRHQMIPLEDAEKVLGEIALVRLSNDFRNAIRALNYGEPLSQTASRSALRREMSQLASGLIQLDPKNVTVGGR